MIRASGAWQRKWWCVLLCCILCVGCYLQAIQGKKDQAQKALSRLAFLKEQKMLALSEGEDLRLQIDSQSDPSWVEMILMRDLGVVPEGWLKVHFKR